MMEVTSTTKGKPLLCLNGYEYNLLKTNRDSSKLWRCIMQKDCNCYVSVTTMGNQIIRQPREHCHDADLVKSSARKLKSSHIASVQRQPCVCTRQIVGRGLADVPDNIFSVLPRKQALMRQVQAERSTINGEQLNPRERQFQMPAEYQTLIVHDSEEDDEERILELGQRVLFRHLRYAPLWLFDGTFVAVPGTYSQLYSFHATIGNNFPACLHALLPNKEETPYRRLLDALGSQMVQSWQNPARL